MKSHFSRFNLLVKVVTASFSLSIFFTMLHYFLIKPIINFFFNVDVSNSDPLEWFEILLTQIGAYWIFLFFLFCGFSKYGFFDKFVKFCINIFSYLFMMPFFIFFIYIVVIFIVQSFEVSYKSAYLSFKTAQISCFVFSIFYFCYFIQKEIKNFLKTE